MWRISDDFWDKWSLLKEQFQLCADWAPFSAPGHFPDADMLPLGVIRASKHSHTHFTKDEQYTLMTLWSIFRSPLIYGGDLPQADPFTLSLLTNDEVLAVDQHSSGGRQIFRKDDLIAWTANADGSGDKYLAVFNARDDANTAPTVVSVGLKEIGFAGPCKVRDLWKQADLGEFAEKFEPVIPPHGAGLYRVSLEK
jgi:hypothetical protein